MYGSAMTGPNTYSTPISPAVIHSANNARRRHRRTGLGAFDSPPAELSAPESVFLCVVIGWSFNVSLLTARELGSQTLTYRRPRSSAVVDFALALPGPPGYSPRPVSPRSPTCVHQGGFSCVPRSPSGAPSPHSPPLPSSRPPAPTSSLKTG